VDSSYAIDTGATLSYAPGVDAGYYIAYAGAGHWHLEWTCDTRLSAEGCNFTGTITAATPPGGLNATCFECEPDDVMQVTPKGASTAIDFDTLTTSGIDGADFTTTPGSSIGVELLIDGLYQSDLVYVPAHGRAENLACSPAEIVPSAP
jgi:hypothetical protein